MATLALSYEIATKNCYAKKVIDGKPVDVYHHFDPVTKIRYLLKIPGRLERLSNGDLAWVYEILDQKDPNTTYFK